MAWHEHPRLHSKAAKKGWKKRKRSSRPRFSRKTRYKSKKSRRKY